jgi:hypothetical protein
MDYLAHLLFDGRIYGVQPRLALGTIAATR